MTVTGLMFYNARYYDPVARNFVSPDTIIPDPASMLGWNRYAYVNNNPINANDPTGHCLKSNGLQLDDRRSIQSFCSVGDADRSYENRYGEPAPQAPDRCQGICDTVVDIGRTTVEVGTELAQYVGDRVSDEFVDWVQEPDAADIGEILTTPLDELVGFIGALTGIAAGGDVIAGGGDSGCPAQATCIVDANWTLFGNDGQAFNETLVVTTDDQSKLLRYHEAQHFYDAEQATWVVFATVYAVNSAIQWANGRDPYHDNTFERRADNAAKQLQRQEPW